MQHSTAHQGWNTTVCSRVDRAEFGALRSAQVRDYMYQLEAHLAEVHRQAQRLIRQQASLGGALAEFGESMLGLGKFESGPLADGFSNLGAKADTLARASQARRDPALLRHMLD